MLYKESLWIKEIINKSIPDRAIILNFGSQSESVYKYQPYLYSNVICELTKKN